MSGGSGAHTYYLPGGVEEVTPSGSLIKYYSAGGMTLGLNTGHDASGISYLASDGLGSVSEALSPGGSATGAQLYSPYGGVRYTSGVMPTSKGFTGQYSDAASTGLDYYGARYYDPALGQFTSADTVTDGLNRYGYVKGSPETATDPTGHRMNCKEDGGCSSPGSKPKKSPPPPPKEKAPPHQESCDGVTLNGKCWTLSGKGSIYNDRIGFNTAFMEVYGKTWFYNWGWGEIQFMEWIVSSGRMAMSLFWRGVDAELITNMFDAARDWQAGIFQDSRSLVENWLHFIASPGLNTFWNAHNTSIFSAAHSAAGERWFHEESHNEQLFINGALYLLAAGQDEQVLPGPTGPCWPGGLCIGWITNLYPSYPAPASWFATPFGSAVTAAACIRQIIAVDCF